MARSKKSDYWSHKRFRQRQRDYIDELRKAPCLDCGQQYLQCVMQFDHARGGKKGKRTIGALAGQVGWPKLLAEIALCDVVCANCHAIRTHLRGENKRGGQFAHMRKPQNDLLNS